jgi:hypothetical protein
MFLGSFLGMTFGVILFVLYDRHYYSKSFKKNIVHSTIFAIGISLLSISSAHIIHSFELQTTSGGSVAWLVSILRTVSFVASTPTTTYLISRLMKRYFSTF